MQPLLLTPVPPLKPALPSPAAAADPQKKPTPPFPSLPLPSQRVEAVGYVSGELPIQSSQIISPVLEKSTTVFKALFLNADEMNIFPLYLFMSGDFAF